MSPCPKCDCPQATLFMVTRCPNPLCEMFDENELKRVVEHFRLTKVMTPTVLYLRVRDLWPR